MGRGDPLSDPVAEVRVDLVLAPFGSLDFRALAGALPPDETARAERFRVDSARRAFVAGRALARTLLAERLSMDPASIPIETSKNGKPYAVGHDGRPAEWRFSLSHSGELAAVAMARLWEVGVDAEPADRPIDARRVAERFFPPSDRRAMAGLEGDALRGAFLRLWTLREAVVKAFGATMAEALSQEFHVDASPDASGDASRVEVSALGRRASVVRCDDQEHLVVVAVAHDERATARLCVAARRVQTPARFLAAH